MALTDLEALFPGRAVVPSSEYPQGAPQDDSTGTAGDGTPTRAEWLLDLWGAMAAVMKAGGITASGVAETADASDFLLALSKVINQKVVGWITSSPVAYYLNNTFDTTSEDAILNGVAISADSLRIYTTGNINDSVYQYDLSSYLDLSSATPSGSFSVTSETTNPAQITFNPDESKMYVNDVSDVFAYDLGTAGDITTAVYNSETFTAASTTFMGCAFSPDGTSFLILNGTGDVVELRTLSTPFDISTSGAIITSFSLAAASITSPKGLTISPDGMRVIVGSVGPTSIFQFDLVSPFVLTNAEYYDNELDVDPQVGSLADIAFSADGSQVFVASTAGNDIYAYNSGFLRAV